MTTKPQAEYRHPLATRLTHWLSFCSFFVLLGTGLQIFNGQAYLSLTNDRDHAHTIASLTSPQDGIGIITVAGHAMRITGWPQWTADPKGKMRPQFFPAWLVIPFGQNKRAGQDLHRYFAWPFLLAGLLYAGARLLRGDLDEVFLSAADLPHLLPMLLFELRLRRDPPPYGKYNPLQKLAYTLVVFVAAPLIVLSGFAAWSRSPLVVPLTALFGNRDAARFWHVAAMCALLAFFAVHIAMVVTTGFLRNVRAMITGWRHGFPADITNH